MNSITTPARSPFHIGEHTLQSRTGKREAMEKFGNQAIRSFLPEQHREFYQQLPFLVVGSVDQRGAPWASILPGEPGFAYSPTPTTLILRAKALKGDPLCESLSKLNSPLGILGIEIPTRRRNRLNARVSNAHDEHTELTVDQSFGNCPQYIQTRNFQFLDSSEIQASSQQVRKFSNLDDHLRRTIRTSDTFFVSSFVPTKDRPEIEGVDVSHRGGMPGFVKADGNTLTIPDYSGNFHFNTLGNFLINPKAGLVFPDFETGNLLMLSGKVTLLWEDDPEVKAFKGAERGWRFTLEKGLLLERGLPFRAPLKEYSPNSTITGTWIQAKAVMDAERLRHNWQPLKVTKITKESDTITSIYLIVQPYVCNFDLG
ncbi:MAG: flavin-nucleotide-binding protein [Gammaproteobacteria bacterium]|nr:flavin-nucleotide-binding protein [Gammaproteobacteria bacterium]